MCIGFSGAFVVIDKNKSQTSHIFRDFYYLCNALKKQYYYANDFCD